MNTIRLPHQSLDTVSVNRMGESFLRYKESHLHSGTSGRFLQKIKTFDRESEHTQTLLYRFLDQQRGFEPMRLGKGETNGGGWHIPSGKRPEPQ